MILYVAHSDVSKSCLQPGDMSLEEIEGKLSSLIKAETISQLKSGLWKERLEGLLLCSMNHLFYFLLLTLTIMSLIGSGINSLVFNFAIWFIVSFNHSFYRITGIMLKLVLDVDVFHYAFSH